MLTVNEISEIVDKSLIASLDFFQSKDSTKNVLLSTDRFTSNSTDTKFLEILLTSI